jgi:hypothetical protein
MPRYFLHLRYGADLLAVDEEGDELHKLQDLRPHVEQTARDLMRTARLAAIPNWQGCVFEVTDDVGDSILILPFREVPVSLVH